MTCPQCQGIEMTFDEESVEKELRFYRRDGADETTKWLVDAIRQRGVQGRSLLDIGGGLGAIQHELLDSGLKHATHVDASTAYLNAAKEEAERRGVQENIEWRHGDFVDLASELEPSDIVTLDRVVCCYDDMPALVGASSALARQVYGLVFPRDVWWTRLGFSVMNFFQRLFKQPFRVFVHPVEQLERLLAEAGLDPVFQRHTFLWQVALYARS